MAKVKICGITNLDDAKTCVGLGANALGFVFYKKSPRYINPRLASAIIKKLPKGMKKVGVFVDAKEGEIKRIARLCHLDMLQFHGDESPSFCKRFARYKVIKAFRVKRPFDLEAIKAYDTYGYLFDAYSSKAKGGTGDVFDWNILSGYRPKDKVVFLSGGLNPRNIKRASSFFAYQWVDLSSSLESSPGKKSRAKVENFMKAIRSVRS